MPKPKAKYRWVDVGDKEIMEVNTERMQYTRSSQGDGLQSAGGSAGTPQKPWRVEVKPKDKWVFVGCWPTALTARAAAIEHYERFVSEGVGQLNQGAQPQRTRAEESIMQTFNCPKCNIPVEPPANQTTDYVWSGVCPNCKRFYYSNDSVVSFPVQSFAPVQVASVLNDVQETAKRRAAKYDRGNGVEWLVSLLTQYPDITDEALESQAKIVDVNTGEKLETFLGRFLEAASHLQIQNCLEGVPEDHWGTIQGAEVPSVDDVLMLMEDTKDVQ